MISETLKNSETMKIEYLNRTDLETCEMAFKDIIDRYSEVFRSVEEELLKLFNSEVSLIPVIGRYIVEGGGKRIRPLLHILSAELLNFRGEERIEVSAIIESIHTASLLHDDVIDNANMRRGKKTAHRIWGNQTVILLGDFLYSNALKRAVALKNQRIMETLSTATTLMTEGEVFQLSMAGNPDINEEDYLKIISAKTGALIAAACKLGGILSRSGEDSINVLDNFGMKVGMAFQMVDDILDYISDEDEFGKNLGKDIEEGKITLPLIYLKNIADGDIKIRLIEIIKNGTEEDDLTWLKEQLVRYNCIESAYRKAESLIEEAKKSLEVFENSNPKKDLITIADYALKRRH